jgi:hypothetical protein
MTRLSFPKHKTYMNLTFISNICSSSAIFPFLPEDSNEVNGLKFYEKGLNILFITVQSLK